MVLSVIIPVYNGETTLATCLSSIYSSALSDVLFEVIIVDDNSSDGTPEVIAEWKQRHSNIKSVRHPVNKRQGAARNSGLKIASGDYVFFSDADDIIQNGIVQCLEYAIKENVDVVLGNVLVQNDTGQLSVYDYNIPIHKMISRHDFCESYIFEVPYFGAPWNFLIKRDFLLGKSLFFVEGVQFEDSDWVDKVMYNLDTIAYSGDRIYCYCYNEKSTVHSFSPDRDAARLLMCYRRMSLSYKTQGKLPNYSNWIFKLSSTWISQVLSFRHLSRYNHCNIKQFYSQLDNDVLSFFVDNYHDKKFPLFALKNRQATILIITVCYLPALICRKVVRKVRKCMANIS